MTNSKDDAPKGVSRRTVTKAMAWSVPAVAVAATVPIASASYKPPPPPNFDFNNGFKNPGNSCHDYKCVAKQSYTTPVTVSNPSLEDYIIVFTDYKINGVSLGAPNVFQGGGSCGAISGKCSKTCASVSGTQVCVPAGTTSMTFYVSSQSFGQSPNGSQDVPWIWLKASNCSVYTSGTASSASAPPGSCAQ